MGNGPASFWANVNIMGYMLLSLIWTILDFYGIYGYKFYHYKDNYPFFLFGCLYARPEW